MQRATVTYLINGTTRHLTLRSERISVQIGQDATVVQLQDADGTTHRVHLFRHGEYVDHELVT